VERFSKLGRDQSNDLTSGLLLSHAERIDASQAREALV
jgi:hypothetical protein